MVVDGSLAFAREKMVRTQLRRRGIHDRGVLAAMGRVPRERFMRIEPPEEAYADRAWGIDCGQTISQPYMVALMTEALELSGGERVLEIGTGSGYQTAVLAELAGRVISLERHEPLSLEAAAALCELGYGNVQLVVADGTQGWPAEAPYDRILVAAAAERAPAALLAQLAEGGLLVMPIGPPGDQLLKRFRKTQDSIQSMDLTSCRFVPLVGDGD